MVADTKKSGRSEGELSVRTEAVRICDKNVPYSSIIRLGLCDEGKGMCIHIGTVDDEVVVKVAGGQGTLMELWVTLLRGNLTRAGQSLPSEMQFRSDLKERGEWGSGW